MEGPGLVEWHPDLLHRQALAQVLPNVAGVQLNLLESNDTNYCPIDCNCRSLDYNVLDLAYIL